MDLAVEAGTLAATVSGALWVSFEVSAAGCWQPASVSISKTAVVGTKSEIEGDGFGLAVENGLEFTELTIPSLGIISNYFQSREWDESLLEADPLVGRPRVPMS